MTTNREVLLSCPFCKFEFSLGNSIAHKKSATGSASGYWWTCRCPICRTYGPRAHSEQEAKDAWNRRSALTAQGGEQNAEIVSAPKKSTEAMIEELSIKIAADAYEKWSHWFHDMLQFKFAIKWAIHEYIRRSAGKEKG